MVSRYPQTRPRPSQTRPFRSPVIYLDWTGLDPCSNPVHPNKISFGSWSSTKIQTIQCKIYTKNSKSWHIFGVSMTDRWRPNLPNQRQNTTFRPHLPHRPKSCSYGDRVQGDPKQWSFRLIQ